MDIYRNSQDAASHIGSSAVAIGNFDGVHVGHQELLRRTVAAAQQLASRSVVVTFSPHPAQFFRPDLAPPFIMQEAQKLELIAASGIDATVVLRFDADLAQMTAATFAKKILAGDLGARYVTVGKNFAFGHDRSGDLSLLKQLGADLGFVADGVRSLAVDGITVSSTKIREFILMGRADGAARLLGRPHFVDGIVVQGAARGRTIGFPTANLETHNELIPAQGVYVGWATVGRQENGNDSDKPYGIVVNVGYAPTFCANNGLRIEAHLLDFSGDLVGKALRVHFIKRLRGEKRFVSPEALVSAIKADVEQAKTVLSRAAVK